MELKSAFTNEQSKLKELKFEGSQSFDELREILKNLLNLIEVSNEGQMYIADFKAAYNFTQNGSYKNSKKHFDNTKESILPNLFHLISRLQ